MEAISYIKARNQLCNLMEQVCRDHDLIIITRQKNSSVEDYNAKAETMYNPNNAKRLIQAKEDFKNKQNFEKFSL